jgi:hypothetical protein
LLAFLAQWAFRLAKFSTKWFYLATLKKEMLLKKKEMVLSGIAISQ